MKKNIVKTLILWIFVIFPISVFAQFSEDMTTVSNWSCIESDHIWSNDCNRVFFWYNGTENLSSVNYWQSSAWSWHWVWFHFNGFKKIWRYTIVNTFGTDTFYIKSWHLTALTSTWEITIDTQSSISMTQGNMLIFDIQNPIYSNEYKLYIDETWVDWILITQIELKEVDGTITGTQTSITQYESVFDQQTVFDLASVEMVWLIIVAILWSIFYFKKPWF